MLVQKNQLYVSKTNEQIVEIVSVKQVSQKPLEGFCVVSTVSSVKNNMRELALDSLRRRYTLIAP